MVKLLIKYTNEVIMIFDITKEYISLQWKKKMIAIALIL